MRRQLGLHISLEPTLIPTTCTVSTSLRNNKAYFSDFCQGDFSVTGLSSWLARQLVPDRSISWRECAKGCRIVAASRLIDRTCAFQWVKHSSRRGTIAPSTFLARKSLTT